MSDHDSNEESLNNTNKLLDELHEKLTSSSLDNSDNVSTTSSQQTHTSSVVHNSNLLGLGKQNIRSQVIKFIIDEEDNEDDKQRRIHNNIFNPNDIFQERNSKFMTKFATDYNDDNAVNNKLSRKNSLKLTQDRLERNSMNSESTVEQHEEDGDGEDELEEIPAKKYGIFYSTYEDDDDDDELSPPSPPRSPPKELDPDKLYGLYDFSGPDPSHCTLSRDEPVYLINDEDNYWWLIKKLSKLERIERDNENDIVTDSEDEKIGFVPAECLETHGERLARLNCFKNEELEKTTIEHTIEIKTPQNKSVKFENLDDIIDDEIEHDEIRHNLQIYNDISPPKFLNKDEEQSEVLSDIYPNEIPLIINKTSKSPTPTLNESTPVIQQLDIFTQPRHFSNLNDDVSIGSFSPDTPVDKSPVKLDQDVKEKSETVLTLRRSVILDRLTKVTSDIEQQLQLQNSDEEINYEDDDDDDDEENDFSFENYGDHSDEDDSSIIETAYIKINKELPNRPNNHDHPYPKESSNTQMEYRIPKSSTSMIDDETSSTDSNNEDITPLTSMNSLTPIEERRKSKPVHEMFMPILGKFDGLATKLAELDEILR